MYFKLLTRKHLASGLFSMEWIKTLEQLAEDGYRLLVFLFGCNMRIKTCNFMSVQNKISVN